MKIYEDGEGEVRNECKKGCGKEKENNRRGVRTGLTGKVTTLPEYLSLTIIADLKRKKSCHSYSSVQ